MECPYKKNVVTKVVSENTPHEDNENFLAKEQWVKTQNVSFGECSKEDCAVWEKGSCTYK